MDVTIQGASSHTRGRWGGGEAVALPAEPLVPAFAEWPCPQCLSLRLSPGALGQTAGPGHGLSILLTQLGPGSQEWGNPGIYASP